MKFENVSFDSVLNHLDMLSVKAGLAPGAGGCDDVGCSGAACGGCTKGCSTPT